MVRFVFPNHLAKNCVFQILGAERKVSKLDTSTLYQHPLCYVNCPRCRLQNSCSIENSVHLKDFQPGRKHQKVTK